MTDYRTYYLYLANLRGGRYIGVTNNPPRRFIAHARAPSVIGRAIRAADGVAWTILAQGSKRRMYEFEIKAIATYGTRVPNGYNVAEGGGGGVSIPWSKDVVDMMRSAAIAAFLTHSAAPLPSYLRQEA